ncbi:MAG: DUF4956 domain-containing protein [Pseudomonadales bacterium]|jgi:hypothetical protein|nr:DUF4956 domain-containing protein [Pseudomonadales bacterium]MCP5337435.1 DUF4956 domain-containing protein [Pseudomonadales bacterium]
MQPALFELLLRFGIDVAAVVLLIYGLYYRRHHDKELVTTAVMFNFSAFAVLVVLADVQFGVAAGFGLFAILALFRLRSEQFDKIEISYFFGAVAIAVICSVKGTTLPFVLAVVLFLLLGAFVLDHPRILHSVAGVKIVLDKIDHRALTDAAAMRADLGQRLGVEVINYEIKSFDYVNETAHINVFYRK